MESIMNQMAEKVGYDTEYPVLGRLMFVPIYNETTKEGKIIVIPIVTLHIGELEQNNKFYVEFKEFNRILKIAKQAN